ncbi:MAG TPA: carboxypeptidase regulatory-like domain-containing protein [Candidatus Acidoferrales bacterium]|nr:carboxypeptidase regulatory-like domain-containing protein [Candidatus Acidoferrales bacterium]
MKILLESLTAIALAASACGFAQAQAKPPSHGVSAGMSGSDVSGQVRLVEGKSGKATRDRSGVVFWLEPASGIKPTGLTSNRTMYRMVQHNKQFEPHLLVVPLGSVVAFPNLDPWFHNVFSLYRGKRFDLGLYEAGAQKAVRFDRPGASYIFCNIHPEMMAVVLALDTRFYAVSNSFGDWSIPNVPPGRYKLHVWYENATPETLNALESELAIGSDHAVVRKMTVVFTPHNWLHHPNLYGHQYDPKGLTPTY